MLSLRRIYLFLILLLFLIAGIFSFRGFLIQGHNPFKLNLGLELVGGSSLTLEADFPLYLKELGGNSLDELKKVFNHNDIFFNESFLENESKIQNNKNLKMVFAFNNENFEKLINNESKISKELGKSYKLKFNEKGRILEVMFEEEYLNFLKTSALKEVTKNIEKRVDSLGNKEITLETLGENKILLQAPGFDSPEKLKYLIGKTGKLSFHLVDDLEKTNDIFYAKDEKNIEYRLIKEPILDGKLLKGAYANLSQKNETTVHFSLNKVGTEIFAKTSAENVGKRIAIVIDGNVLSAPVIREKIPGGSVEISGTFDYEEASALATSLRSGALPVRLFITEERLVGAAAGNKLIKNGKLALLIALILVSAFMTIVYGVLGLVASFSILLNLYLIISIMILSESTLSLAGIAGLVLTVGIVVDNNVLIFERIREELKINEKAYVRAIKNGFDRALITIIDSNLTTIISASLLFWFGDNNIKGFALTLIYGVAISFFSTIWVSHVIIDNFQAKILKYSFFLDFLSKKLRSSKTDNLKIEKL